MTEQAKLQWKTERKTDIFKHMDLLRFFTAGNVDDGKSTLIGRLLYDSNSISTDIIETLTKQSKTITEDTGIDLALLTDGLRAEREQGITIDVAYKYFSTPKRKFIIADTPGHAEYTRNMFTGASTADLAIILIDARNGITDQTKRHSIISSILRIPEIILVVNKMDLTGYSEAIFDSIQEEYTEFAKKIGLKKVTFIPASALAGDNVVRKSERMPWYEGGTLLDYLENCPSERDEEISGQGRFQVQYIIRPQTEKLHDYRGYAGSVLSGKLKKGELIDIFPSGQTSRIIKIEKEGNEIEEATTNEAVIIHIDDDIDISRGTTFSSSSSGLQVEKDLEATLCWMDNKSFQPGQKFILMQNSFSTKARIKEVSGKIDIHSYDRVSEHTDLHLNEFGVVSIKTAVPIAYDPFDKNTRTGAFILINENTNNTVAAGVLH